MNPDRTLPLPQPLPSLLAAVTPGPGQPLPAVPRRGRQEPLRPLQNVRWSVRKSAPEGRPSARDSENQTHSTYRTVLCPSVTLKRDFFSKMVVMYKKVGFFSLSSFDQIKAGDPTLEPGLSWLVYFSLFFWSINPSLGIAQLRESATPGRLHFLPARLLNPHVQSQLLLSPLK